MPTSAIGKEMEEEATSDDSDLCDSDCGTPEEIQLFYDEWDKSQGFEIDYSKISFCFDWKPFDLEDSSMFHEPENNRGFMAMLANLALTKLNEETNSSLELGQVLRANFHLSAGVTYYISFLVNDLSDANQTKPYRAVVRYLPGDVEVISCYPKPTP